MRFLPHKKFTETLLNWHLHENERVMPWKGEKDPYKIWLSEIILQQTRVEQGWSYYEKFIQHYSTIKQLAAAKDEQVFKLWEGLGYYSRCKNLLFTARLIAKNYKGVFPNDYNDIINLKGVGAYTAAAIASFAYNLPYAVVDGNVIRILARVYDIATPFDTTAGKKEFSLLAQQLLNTKEPALYNQAIMDFGATVCKPKQPLCNTCVFNKVCLANNKGTVGLLPIKAKKITIKERYFYYVILKNKNKIAARLRSEKDVWQNLHEFYLIENDKPLPLSQFNKKIKALFNGTANLLGKTFTQKLTHQKLHIAFFEMDTKALPQGFTWYTLQEIKQLAFPKTLKALIDTL
jgi:A/G-specific adenine glycosylase